MEKGRNEVGRTKPPDPEDDGTKSTGNHGVPVTQAPCWGFILRPRTTTLHSHCLGAAQGGDLGRKAGSNPLSTNIQRLSANEATGSHRASPSLKGGSELNICTSATVPFSVLVMLGC